MFYVYVLYTEKHNKYYVGQTQDVIKRIERHNKGMEDSTRPYVPWKLSCLIEKGSRSEAVVLEKKLKNLGKARLKKFIEKYGEEAGADVAEGKSAC